MCGTLITEHPRQQIHNSNNLNLTCISEAGGKWWRGFVSTGQIMSSQPDVDRWRQRLTLPPALCYTHTHLAAIFSQDNYLATSASPHSHTHTHTLGQLRTHTRSDNSHSRAIHTHTETCHGVYIHTPHPLQLHKIWQPALFMKGTAPSCSFLTQKTDWDPLLHIWQGFLFFF